MAQEYSDNPYLSTNPAMSSMLIHRCIQTPLLNLALPSQKGIPFEQICPKSIKALSKNDVRLKSISFASEWTEYYLFTFPHTKSKSFKLVFQNDVYGKGELHFAKVAKYVLTKTPF